MNSRTATGVILTIKHRKHHCGPGWYLDGPAVVHRCHIRLKDKRLPTGNDSQKINRQYCIWVVIEGVGFALVERSRFTEEKLVRKSGVTARTAGRCCHRYHASCAHGSKSGCIGHHQHELIPLWYRKLRNCIRSLVSAVR